jgi:hypothetical protein
MLRQACFCCLRLLHVSQAGALLPLSAIEVPILQVRPDRAEEGHAHQSNNQSPTELIQRSIIFAEELASDDACAIGLFRSCQ